MDLDELRALLAVVETGSISAAAKSLQFARATLRRRLDELEARMGVPILEREGPLLRPTRAGQLLVERAPKVLAEAQGLLDAVRGTEREPREIHLAMLPGPPAEILSPGLKLFLPFRGRLRFRYHFLEDPTQLPDDATFGFDIAEAVPQGPFRVRAVTQLPVGLWASPHLAKKATSIDALKGLPIGAWRNREGALTELRTTGGERLPISSIVETSDIALLLGLAEKGTVIAYTPRMPHLLEARTLVRLFPDVVSHSVGVRMLIPRRSTDNEGVMERVARFLSVMGDSG